MLTLLKLMQSLIKTLLSEGTPGQVAAGVALGSALGLTPLLNLHNLFIFALIVVVGWLVLLVPIFLLARLGVARYRATVGERVRRSRFYQAVTTSKVYNVYRLFDRSERVAVGVFRWKTIGPLLLALIAIGVLVVLFAERVAEDTTEDVTTDLLGTQVDLSRVALRPREIGADLWRIESPIPSTSPATCSKQAACTSRPTQRRLPKRSLWCGIWTDSAWRAIDRDVRAVPVGVPRSIPHRLSCPVSTRSIRASSGSREPARRSQRCSGASAKSRLPSGRSSQWGRACSGEWSSSAGVSCLRGCSHARRRGRTGFAWPGARCAFPRSGTTRVPARGWDGGLHRGRGGVTRRGPCRHGARAHLRPCALRQGHRNLGAPGRRGDGARLAGHWTIASNNVQWAVDTTTRRLNEVEHVVWRVISGFTDLRVLAELSGT